MTARTSGILPDAALEAAFEAGWIHARRPLEPGQIQPASLDLRLGRKVWRLRASFLPGPGRTVAARLDDDIVMHALDLEGGAVLETGCVYLAELEEGLALPPGVSAAANPKKLHRAPGRLYAGDRRRVDCVRPAARGL